MNNKIFSSTLIATVVITVFLASTFPVFAFGYDPNNQSVTGQIIVKFKEGSSPNEVFLQKHDLQQADRILERYKFTHSVENVFDSVGVDRLYVAKFDNESDLEAVLKRLNRDSQVEYAEPDYIVTASLTPNDPNFSQLWGLENTGFTGGTYDSDIDAPETWDTTNSSNFVVGVIDSGVDYTHEDLVGNMWINPGEIPLNGIDDDLNGFIDDIYGWDFANDDNDPFDDYGHGTHVAGTIGARGNNGIGVTGVNWSAKIAALKFLGSNGSGSVSDAINAISYANLMGIKITNNSWGGEYFSQALYDVISAANDSGNLLIASAGNNAVNTDATPHYPASYDLENIISVANTDHNDLLSLTSNYGATTVDIGAPGAGILSSVPTGICILCDPSGYKLLGGTSMATPHVTGAAVLMWSYVPSLSGTQIKDIMMEHSDTVSSLQGITVSGKRLNLNNSLLHTSASRGYVSLDKNIYTSSEQIVVTVVDGDLDYTSSQDTAVVEVTSNTEQIPEFLLLIETGTSTAVFTGSISLSELAPTSDGLLQVVSGDTITVRYNDVFDGVGPAVVTDTALYDTQAPVISSVGSFSLINGASITWTTDELSDSTVYYGTSQLNLNQSKSSQSMVLSHQITIFPLVPATTYYFDVESTDIFGRSTRDDNGGLHYSLTTLEEPVNTEPVAVVGGPYNSPPLFPILFDGSGSYDTDGDLLTYYWEFGDGATTTIESPMHYYLDEGEYIVTLIVNDGQIDSLPSTTTASIVGINNPPIANAGIDQNAFVGESVLFDGSGSYDTDGDQLTFFWDFGDGNVASTSVANHSYVASGTYVATLTVMDTGGLTGQDTVVATISDPDTTPPTVSITDPVASSTVSGLVNVAATATDDVAVANVEFFLDVDTNSLGLISAPLYEISWNSTLTTDGTHLLIARATDTSGNITDDVVEIIVDNIDDISPTISITAPLNGSTVAGTVSVSADASDNVGVTSVEFHLDTVGNLINISTTEPHDVFWNTNTASEGSHTLIVRAYDGAGNYSDDTISVTVQNVIPDTTPPTVSITDPLDGATVPKSNVTVITADATDDTSVAYVDFYVDGNLKCGGVSGTYTCDWNVPGGKSREFTLEARAYDNAGNEGISIAVTVSSGGGSGGGGGKGKNR